MWFQNLLEPTEPVYSCAACFGHDLCAECQRDGAAEAHAEANRALCGMRVEWAAFDEDVELAVEPPRRLGAVVAAGADPCAQVGDESPPRT